MSEVATHEAQGGEARRLLTIVIPVLDEEDNIERAYGAVKEVVKTLSDTLDHEILFLDNHSTDDSFARIREVAGRDVRVRAVRFKRNYGFHRSVLTGLRLARGDAALQIDCDLQDPPELIPEFVHQWRAGADLVYGVRQRRQEGWAMVQMRKGFYRLLNRISDENLPLDAGDFALVDREILDQLRRLHDAHPYVRGLVASLSRRAVGVPYERARRAAGESKYPFWALFSLAFDGIVAHSILPLRLAAWFGVVFGVLTFLLGVAYAVSRLIWGVDWPAGFTTTTVLILLSLSVNSIFLGILGEYIGRSYALARGLPITVIEDAVNL